MFIVFEGIDGAGKTTQAKLLERKLLDNNIDAVYTKEPWDKVLVKDERNRDTDLFMFGADRILHVENFIKPALDQGKVVICDRFFYSTIAYQRKGFRHTSLMEIGLMPFYHLIKATACGISPDLNIYIRIPFEAMVSRKGKDLDQIGKDQMEHYHHIIEDYDTLFDYNDKKHFVFDGRKEIDVLSSEIFDLVKSKI